jgi:pimeloyl-ACP methyl ester carboxylesterase
MALAYAGCLVACGLSSGETSHASDTTRHPVLMVHGAGLDSSYWRDLTNALAQDGYPREYLAALDLLPNNGANVRAAEELIQPAVDRLLKVAARESMRTGRPAPRKVILVSHSMGALSTRWYVARIAPELVAGWIGIAPANHGTNAMCGFGGAGERELCPAFAESGPDSKLQLALNGAPGTSADESPFGLGTDSRERKAIPPDAARRLSYWTLRIEPDEWIVPAESAILDGAGGIDWELPESLRTTIVGSGNYRFVAAVRHDDLPPDPRVVQWVVALVRAINREA